MHINVVDIYQEGESPLHRLDARAKVLAAFLLILLISLSPMGAFGVYGLLLLVILTGVWIGRLRPAAYLRRSLIAIPFALAAVTLMFTVPGRTLWTVPLTGWTVSDAGLARFGSIVIKSWLSVQVAVLMGMTTHFTDLLCAMRALHVPRVLVAIISFMYRYIFVLADEALRLTRARESRSATGPDGRGGGTLAWRMQVTGGMVGNLFLRSYERSERVYQAMAARGYKGELRQLAPPPIHWKDIFWASLPVAAAAIILVGNQCITLLR
jgi:cobalt/nickel transport system permease protein